MLTPGFYIIAAVVVLVAIAVILFVVYKNRKERKPSPLVALAFAFIIAGILFGNSRRIGYSLIGTGVLLAIIDIIIKSTKK
jgi:MFS superfamily sulfate permease-like transporter